jgi:hypothetical protein
MVKLLKNLPTLVLVVLVGWLLYNYGGDVLDTAGSLVGMGGDDAEVEVGQYGGQAIDMGVYNVHNPNAFGTTSEEERRVTNDGVRKEYHVNPFPWAECTCSSGHCDKHGIPKPAPGHTHVCKNGFPSKRIVDMYGGHFQLNHICAPGTGECAGEPAVLGRWWCRKGCSNAESVGLNVRPICSSCK